MLELRQILLEFSFCMVPQQEILGDSQDALVCIGVWDWGWLILVEVLSLRQGDL